DALTPPCPARKRRGGGAAPGSVAAPATNAAVTLDGGGSAGSALRRCPRPAAVTTGLVVGPSTVCLLSSDMAESPWANASLVGRHFEGPATASIQKDSGLPQGLDGLSVADRAAENRAHGSAGSADSA